MDNVRRVPLFLKYKARVWQRNVSARLKRFSVLVVHRRGGKTVLAVNTLIRGALTCKKPFGRFGYIAPLLKQAREIAWDYAKEFCREIPGVTFNESLMQVRFPNGARLQLFGADNPDSLRGGYWDGVVPDEVADMRPALWDEVLRPALSDRRGWALFIGTPRGINLFSELYFKAIEDPNWYAALLTCYDTDALPPDEIEQAKRDMHPEKFAQEYLCDFHAAVEDALISVDLAQSAMRRKLRPEQYSFAPRIMGVDVARMGRDRSVIARRQGLAGVGHRKMRKLTEPALIGQVARAASSWKPDAIFIDIGYMPGVYDHVLELGYPAMAVDFGGSPDHPRFENKRAEMWWRMAKWLEQASVPNDHELMVDLCAPKYSFTNVRGKIQLESKDDLRDRGLPSPDIADAWALTFAFNVAPRDLPRGHARATRTVHEYDPLGG
jgi:hypothetical protein